MRPTREVETELQRFAEFILANQLVRQRAAPFVVGWVRRFLNRPATPLPLADRVRAFCEELERLGTLQDWQVRQAESALRIYFANFLGRTDWLRTPASAIVEEHGAVNPLAALEQLRLRVRTRHYSIRTESCYADWGRRFLEHLAQQQNMPHPRVDTEAVRNHIRADRRAGATRPRYRLTGYGGIGASVPGLVFNRLRISAIARSSC